METQIKETLTSYFEDKRIVFWYDEKKQFKEDFDELEIPNVKKIVLENNEFGVKYKVLREEPTQRFLIYKAGKRPEDIQNWLLDVLLANQEFKTEQTALWLTDLNLGYEHLDITKKHAAFFKNKVRRESLKALINPSEDTTSKIQLKMLAVCTKAEADIEAVLESLLSEYANGKEDKINLIKSCNLEEFLNKVLERKFNYNSNNPSIKDFILKLMNSSYKNNIGVGLNEKEKFSNDAYVFLKRWKDSRQNEEAFETISNEVAKILDIEADIDSRNYKNLLESDTFSAIDTKILYDLTQMIAKKTISKEECLKIIRQRKNKRWNSKKEISNHYKALWHATLFINEFNLDPQFEIDSLQEGVSNYSKIWNKIDFHYRKFIYFMKETGQVSLFENLYKEIENTYSNKYLLKLNDNWQQQLDKTEEWKFEKIEMQRNFYNNYIDINSSKNNKLFVIISDAMRYEIGDELVSLIRQEDRFEAKITPAISSIPSYTQLGMASLLPNKELSIIKKESDEKIGASVAVDGVTAVGLNGRLKVLKNVSNMKITAEKADAIIKMTKEELRDIFRENDVLYIFHDRIDSVGHKLETEERTTEAVEDALSELIKLIKKLTGANANNIIVTSDHGFIYQNEPLVESDFIGVEPEGGSILFSDRRFIIGKDLIDKPNLKKYKAKDIGLNSDLEFQFPKSINRLRKSASASRYVHGGLSLQEVVIPVVQINKKRQSDTSKVDVEVLKNNNIISSNQIAVKFYQENCVDEKLQPRTLRVGIYNKGNELLSDSHELTFDYTSENARDREMVVTFILKKKIDEANGQEVKLKLEENEAGTDHYKEYKSTSYMVRKTFANDFDF
jgi:uncharacterized protein (TIGR02687 family)